MKKSRQAFIEQGIVRFGGGFLMVWECMGQNGVGIFVEMEGCMDAEQYVSTKSLNACTHSKPGVGTPFYIVIC